MPQGAAVATLFTMVVSAPFVLTHAARMSASVFISAVGSVISTTSFTPRASPEPVFTRLFAGPSVFAKPTTFVAEVPTEVVNAAGSVITTPPPCESGAKWASVYAAATVVTSLIVTKVEAVKELHGPSSATSTSSGLTPAPGFPPLATR